VFVAPYRPTSVRDTLSASGVGLTTERRSLSLIMGGAAPGEDGSWVNPHPTIVAGGRIPP
jgi:hypothetical protein